MYEIGEEVVCVDDKFHPEIAALFQELPKKDVVYTVRDCSIGTKNSWVGNGGEHNFVAYKLLLKEIKNSMDPHTENGCREELGFNAERFRSLEEYYQEKEEKVTVGVGKKQLTYVDA